jgi:putative RNA 2'-phosphotransferase
MNRQYVHLSADREMAHQIGRRKAREPIVLQVCTAIFILIYLLFFIQIEAKRASDEAGVRFYRPVNETIWLADSIPSEFIQKVEN